MRIRDVSGDRLQLVRLRERHAEAQASSGRPARAARRAADTGLDARPRRRASTGATRPTPAPSRPPTARPRSSPQVELFDPAALRDARRAARQATGVWRRRAPASVGGRAPDVRGVRSRHRDGSAGIARDLSEIEALRADMERNDGRLSRMLDQLSTAVAIFDAVQAARSSTTPPIARSGRSIPPFSTSTRPTARSSTGCAPSGSCPNRPISAPGRRSILERLSGDRADRDRLASARRARACASSPAPSRGRRHLSLRRRHAELRARLAGQRADPRAGRDARRAEGRRRGVRRGRPAEARQSRPSPRCGASTRHAPRDRPHIDEIARACCRSCGDPELCDDLRAAIVGLPEQRASV